MSEENQEPSSSSAGEEPNFDELNELLPAYSFEGFIASGGMGSVDYARQKSLDRPVAIKLLKAEFGRKAEFRESFEREAKAMAKLNHVNLVGVYDFGEVGGRLYIVMEHIDGQSLHDACHGKRLDPEEAARLVIGICRGLYDAHSHGVIHRDIKPANILVDRNCTPKILDFGIAEPMGIRHGATEDIYGTPGYSAPETTQRGMSLDGRSDVYSVGVVFYELLTGQLPGPEPARPSELVGCSRGYDRVVLNALHTHPDGRYPNAEMFGEAIEAVLNDAEAEDNDFPSAAVVKTSVASVGTVGAAVRGSYRPAAVYQPTRNKSAGTVALVLCVVGVMGVLAFILLRDGEGNTEGSGGAPELVESKRAAALSPMEPRARDAGTDLDLQEVTEARDDLKSGIEVRPTDSAGDSGGMQSDEPKLTERSAVVSDEEGVAVESLPDVPSETKMVVLIGCERTWSTTDGQSHRSILQGIFEDKAYFATEDDDYLEGNIADLSAVDQAYIERWLNKQRIDLNEHLQVFTDDRGHTFDVKPVGVCEDRLYVMMKDGSPDRLHISAFDERTDILFKMWDAKRREEAGKFPAPELGARKWRNSEGQVITATLLDVSDDHQVRLRKTGGRVYTVALDVLSEGDVEYSIRWLLHKGRLDHPLLNH